MRMSWLRALPRGRWGGPALPELCRSLCQRPARVPSEGGDTAGTPRAGGHAERDTPGGDTSRGDTSRGDTSKGDTLGGDTSRGHSSRGDTPKGDTSRGDISGGHTSWGDISRGHTSRSDTPRGDTSRGDTSKGDTSQGDASRGHTSRGDTSKGDTPGGDTSKGDTPGGDTSTGSTSKVPPRRLRSHKTHQDDHGDHHDDHHDDQHDGPGGGRGGAGAFQAALRELGRFPAGRGGRLALLEAALAAMPALGAERSLAAYNALLRLLPRGPWVPRGPLQRLLFPFPRQQESGLRLLEQMERYGVMPDAETRFLLLGVFGPRSRPVRKVQRMLFWLPRFRHLDPHPLPPELPPAALGTARLALRRIANDPAATVTVIQRPVPDTGEDEGSVQPYIVSSQSPEQRELLAQHDPSRPVFVEGPFPLWLRGTPLSYFVLRGEPLPPELRNPPPDPERSFYFPLHLELELERGPWDDDEFHVEPVEEGPVLALCVAGAADRRTLARWISALQELNPVLGRAPVILRIARGGDPSPEPPPEPPSPRLGQGEPPGAALEPPEGQGRPGGDPPKNSGE